MLHDQAFAELCKSAERLQSGMTPVSNDAVASAATPKDFATPLLQEAGGGELPAAHARRSDQAFLTVREVAAAVRVCAATVYRMCERGELPHARVANAIRVRATDLQAVIRSGVRRGR